jgi:GNAT superfamily N-acetyltransferase
MKVRGVNAADKDALCAISLATGFAGKDASHLYRDGTLIGQIYSAPYAFLEPDLALVAEDHDGVAGFVVGVVDTLEWEKRLDREWWPRLREQYARPAGPPSEWSPDERRIEMIHSPERVPRSVSCVFPAHVHLNLLPRLQGRGIGSELLRHWFSLTERRGSVATHVGVNRENARASKFWARSGFLPLEVEHGASRTAWMGRS